jgi:hypothetical protein
MLGSGVATAGHLGQMSQLKIINLAFKIIFFESFAHKIEKEMKFAPPIL